MSNIPDLVSVIFASYNRREKLLNAINDIQKQTYKNLEIIVVDNGSTDGTASAIKETFPNVYLIELSQNLGCPSGRNVGIRAAQGEFIATLDDDAELEPTSIKKAVAILKENPDVAVLTGKVLNYETKQPEFWQYKAPMTFIEKSFYTYYFAEGCSVLRKSVLDQVGLYPENFIRQYENRDLGNRILDAGYKIVYFPGIIIYHDSGRRSVAEFYYGYRNLLYIYIKQYRIHRLLIYGIASTSIYFCHFMRLGKPYLLFKAWYETSKELKYLIQSRKVLKQDTIKYINQLKKHVRNLPKYFDKVKFNCQAN